jgi:hypothetical protein
VVGWQLALLALLLQAVPAPLTLRWPQHLQ